MSDNSNVTLIIPTYRNPAYLDLCLKSAVENRMDEKNHILVIVDGYIEESQAVLDKYPGVLYLALEQNMGMQYAINAGVMQSTTSNIFVINDDNVMCTDWDVRISEHLYRESIRSDRPFFVLTVNQVEPTGPGMFNFHVKDLGQTVETFDYDAWLDYEAEISDGATERIGGNIFPFAISKRLFMAVGGFDTFYNSPNICDWDFFLKLELLDTASPRLYGMHLYHFGSVSTKKNAESNTFKQREVIAQQQFEWKWGVTPHNAQLTNSKLPPNREFRGFRAWGK